MTPFSLDIRNIIHARAHEASELSGETQSPTECSHFNHDRSSPLYNKPENGLLTTTLEHGCFHLRARGRASRIGLSENHNEAAIRFIQERYNKYCVENDISPEQTQQDLENAHRLWAEMGY